MLSAAYELASPFLRALDPEHAHELVLKLLEAGLYRRAPGTDDPRLAIAVWSCRVPNPLGIAAGFDKDARVVNALLSLGFGYAEIGTLTPRPQAGNPRPRIFRLSGDRALINRLGFNNAGHAAALARLQRRAAMGVIGVNLGANKDTPDRSADYVEGLTRFYDVASYFMINVSSPNTPGLRDLQAPVALGDLLARLMSARSQLVSSGKEQRPILVKLAPDLAEADLEPIVRVLVDRAVDGIAVSNTTLSRSGLTDPARVQAGGLSGRPLFHRSTVMLARVYRLTRGRIPLVGVGGIDSGSAAIAKIEAGATLLQLYTGLVYEGPALLARIKSELVVYAERHGLGLISDAVGRCAEEWAAKPLELPAAAQQNL